MSRRRARSPVFIGAVALVVAALLLFFGFTKSIPFKPHYEVEAVFETANQLKSGAPVRIAGVEVGKVQSVEALEAGGDGAVVKMRINDDGRPVHEDATAKIRPRIFLEGNFFVDLTAGSPSAPELDDGDRIPINQTSTPVQLDQILTSLQSDARADLKTLLKEYGTALGKDGARGYNRSIRFWKPAYRDSAIVSEAMLGQSEHDLSGYIKHAGAVAAALDRDREALKNLVTDFRITAGAFAREDANLRAAIAELPRTLEAAMPALAALNDAFPPLRAFATEFRPGVRSTGPMIDASLPFFRELRGLVSKRELRGLANDLQPTVADLARLSRDSIPFYRQARRFAGCNNDTFLPWSRDKVEDKQFPAEGPVYQEAPKPLVGLAGESRSGDANGSWFRVLAAGGLNLVTLKPGVFATTPEPLLGSNPPKPTSRPPLRPEVPCETQPTPDLRSRPGDPPPQQMIDPNDPELLARVEKAREAAVEWAQEEFERNGLDDVPVVGDAVTPERVEQLADELEKPVEGQLP
jgi:virulence factor Mce-like protein